MFLKKSSLFIILFVYLFQTIQSIDNQTINSNNKLFRNPLKNAKVVAKFFPSILETNKPIERIIRKYKRSKRNDPTEENTTLEYEQDTTENPEQTTTEMINESSSSAIKSSNQQEYYKYKLLVIIGLFAIILISFVITFIHIQTTRLSPSQRKDDIIFIDRNHYNYF